MGFLGNKLHGIREGMSMLARWIKLFLLASSVLSVTMARAEIVSDFVRSVVQDTKRRNCWPQPFVCPDRQYTRAPFAIQVSNGWRRQNMLSSYHFEPQTGKLTESGQLKIRWILFEAPLQHKSIYVHIGNDTDETAARIRSVEAYASQFVSPADMPPITQTTISEEGSPAEQIDAIARKYQSSTPIPRLPVDTGSGGNSGGSQ